jgi:hypothetical protein
VRARLHFLEESLVEHVETVLAAGEASSPKPEPAGRWRGVWTKARSFFSARDAADMQQLQASLQELHSEIFAQIEAEVRGQRASAFPCFLKPLFV